MSLWKIAWRSIQHRALASGLTAFSMSLGVALIVTVLVIHGVLSQSFQRSAQGYDLIVGPKGSSLELVISTVFYKRDPIGTIPYQFCTELRSGAFVNEVETAIPIALGEHYRGKPVIATTSEFFTRLTYQIRGVSRNYKFRSGECFSDGSYYDAVIGYNVARETGLKVGDKFKTVHGKTTTEEHQTEYTVVGILEPSGTPNDGALFINIEGFYDMHAGQDDALDKSWQLKKDAPASITKAADHDHADHDHAEHEHETETCEDENCTEHDHAEHDHAAHDAHDGHDHSGEKKVSAILVITKEGITELTATKDILGRADEIRTEKSLYKPLVNVGVASLRDRLKDNYGDSIQVVQPVKEITLLFENIIGNIQIVLLILAVLVVLVAGIGMMVSIYNSMSERRQEIAIMRALGAKRRTVMSIILLESILLSLGGGAFGFLIGHTLIFALSPLISDATGIVISAWFFQFSEVLLIPGLVILASLVGYLPAVVAYRTDVAQSLQQ